MNRLRRRACWLLPLLLAQVACSQARPAPSAVDGVLDLRSWSFDADGIVGLAGDWEFCWDQLLTPGEPPAEPGTCGTIHVPGLWTDGGAAPGSGVATYRLRILLPTERPVLALNVGAPLTAHRLWIDGQSYSGTGRVARQPDGYASQVQNRNHVLPGAADELQIQVQVANFDFRSGGLRRRWILGSQEEVRAWATSVTIRDTTLATVNLLVGLFFLGFFASRPQERTRLYFGLAGVALGLRVVPGNYSDIGQLVAPEMMFPTVLRLEYFVNNFMVFAGMGYFAHKVPGDIPTPIARFIQLGSMAGMLGTVVLPLSFIQIPMRSAWILGAGMLAISLFGLVRAARRGEPNVRITLAAVPLCLAVVLFDSLRAEGAIGGSVGLLPNSMLLMVMTETLALFPMTMLAMILTEAMVLMRTFSRSYETIEQLSEELAVANEDLRETNRAAIRFVPFDFLRLLNRDSIRDVQRGDCQEEEMSIVFCDIRSFTSRVESMTPEDAFRFVNAFTHWMEPAIHAHGGFINQYIGDCIMALFPADGDGALRAGIGMLGALEDFNREEHELRGNEATTRIGIGINSGLLMLGTIGGEERLEDAVIGDAVNLASRVESLTKVYGATCLISGTTWQHLSDPTAYQLRELDLVIVKGRSEPVPIYEVLDGLDPASRQRKLDGLDLFAEARNAYRIRSFDEAATRFGECLERCPEDLAAQLYVERCRRLAVEGVPAAWRGETLLSEK